MADIKRFSFDCGKNLSSVPDLFDWKDFKVGDQKDMFSAQDVCTTKGKKKHLQSMRGNQLPVSAARWLHGSQICFANSIQ
jgi:hypothetical protein